MHFFPPIIDLPHSGEEFFGVMAGSDEQKDLSFSSLLSAYTKESGVHEVSVPEASVSEGSVPDVSVSEDSVSEDLDESLQAVENQKTQNNKKRARGQQGVASCQYQELVPPGFQGIANIHQKGGLDQSSVQAVNSAAPGSILGKNQNDQVQGVDHNVLKLAGQESGPASLTGQSEAPDLEQFMASLERLLAVLENKSEQGELASKVKAHLVQMQELIQRLDQANPEEKAVLRQDLMAEINSLAKVVDANMPEHLARDISTSDQVILGQLEQLVSKLTGKTDSVSGQEVLLTNIEHLGAHLEQLQKLVQQIIQANPEEKAVLRQELMAKISELARVVQNQPKHNLAEKDISRPFSTETMALLQDLRTMVRLLKDSQPSANIEQDSDLQAKFLDFSTSKTGKDDFVQVSRVEGQDLPTRQLPRPVLEHVQLSAERQDNEIRPETRLANSAQQKNQDNVQRSQQQPVDNTKIDNSAPNKAPSFAATKSFTESIFSGQPATEQTLSSGQQSVPSKLETGHAEVLRQVENGAFRNLGQGNKQLVIRLDPPDLGQVSVILQVKGKEVQAVLRTTHQEASHALQDQLGQLRTQLEDQGLRVSRLEVQTQLADSQTESGWQGTEEHNRFQEHREMSLTSQRLRTLGRSKELVQDVQSLPHKEKISPDGLDIFA